MKAFLYSSALTYLSAGYVNLVPLKNSHFDFVSLMYGPMRLMGVRQMVKCGVVRLPWQPHRRAAAAAVGAQWQAAIAAAAAAAAAAADSVACVNPTGRCSTDMLSASAHHSTDSTADSYHHIAKRALSVWTHHTQYDHSPQDKQHC